MPRYRSRAELRERVKREAQRQSDTGAYEDSQWNRTIADAWASVWYQLTRHTDGFGVKPGRLTAAAAGPTVDLPEDFLDLRMYGRAQDQYQYETLETAWPEVRRNRWDRGNRPAEPRFLLEGPYVDGATVARQRVRNFPDLGEGEEVEISYVTQEPSLGDPDVITDDNITIDVIAEPIERALVSYARAVGVSREDDRERQAAELAMAKAVQGFAKVHGQRSRAGVKPASAYQASDGFIGYG